jgi:multidrug efflux pump subunit AcrA (membrane-fusion protein)
LSPSHGPLSLALLTVLVSAGCIGDAAVPATPVSPHTQDQAVVIRGQLQPRLLLTGELQAIRAHEIVVPRTPMWQMPIRWMEADGAVVKRNQKVLELDNTQFSADLEEKRLAEARTINELMRKEADIAVELADREFAREQARILLEKARLEASIPEELRPRRTHQDAQLDLTRSRVALEKADEELAASREAAESELEELRIAKEKASSDVRTADSAIAALIVHAPVDGILVISENDDESRKYQVGDNAWVGLAVMKIPELTSMKVEAVLSDVDDGKVAAGQRAFCTLDTYPDRQYRGTVVEVSPIAQEQDSNSMRRAFRAVVHLDASDPEFMRPGMSVKIEVVPPPIEQVLLVPRDALDFSTGSARVRLRDGSWVDVTLGACDAVRCIATDGLEEGAELEIRG